MPEIARDDATELDSKRPRIDRVREALNCFLGQGHFETSQIPASFLRTCGKSERETTASPEITVAAEGV